jgi:hypothetical protein
MFSICDYNKECFNSILLMHLISQQNVNKFLSFINVDYISISGSTILQILQNNIYNNADLDIYIEVSDFNKDKLNNIKQLFTFLYSLNYQYSHLHLENLLIDLETKLQYNIIYSDEQLSNYSTLKQHIKHYVMLINTYTEFKIDFIFIKSDIENLILNTFDYDIVKNYWKNNQIFSFNYDAISNKTATMHLKHFVKRILSGSRHEFANFIKRYVKYSDRQFKIIIHKTLITPYLFNYIINVQYNTNYNNSIYCNVKLYWNKQLCLDKYYKQKTMLFYSSKLNIFDYDTPTHILKYILLAGIYQRVSFLKKLSLYSDYILNKYVNPDSPALIATVNNWNRTSTSTVCNNTKKFYYLNNCNKLSIITII